MLQKLYYDLAAVREIVGDSTPLIITISMRVSAILAMSEKLSKRLDVTDFEQGAVTLKVRTLDGIPLIPVGADRLKTEYLFRDGKRRGRKAAALSRRKPVRASTG